MPRYIVPAECKPAVYRNMEFYPVGATFVVHEPKDLHIKFVPADQEAWDYMVAKFGSEVVLKKHGELFKTKETPPAPPPVVVVETKTEPKTTELTGRQEALLTVTQTLPYIDDSPERTNVVMSSLAHAAPEPKKGKKGGRRGK